MEVGSGATLSGWRKALRASPDRRTRFHTAEGNLMPAEAWLTLPVQLMRRVTGQAGEGPWMVPSAVRWLSEQIQSDWQILELGSGSSTVWLSTRADVLALEDDKEWMARVTKQIAGHTGSRVEMVAVDDLPARVSRFDGGAFDLVIVDSNESPRVSRIDCLESAAPAVKPGGLLLLDDSDRAGYSRADDLLPGWEVRRFRGVKARPLTATETSVYRRPQ